jgi:ATP-dependent Clp protease protease subunit
MAFFRALLAATLIAGVAQAFRPASTVPLRQAVKRVGAPVRMMPIGVPKVGYRAPGSTQGDWVDIYNRMYRERIMFLGQQIDSEIANQIIGVMLYLDSEDPNKPQYIYINSPGGSVAAGMAMFDTFNHVKSDIVTINVGLAASMGSFLLAAGTRGKRMALPHSRVMIHQPMGGARGQAEDIKVEAMHIMNVRDRISSQYARLTGQPKEKVRTMPCEQSTRRPRVPFRASRAALLPRCLTGALVLHRCWRWTLRNAESRR